MARPSQLSPWASTYYEEITNIAGVPTLVANKVEPTSEFKNVGNLARRNLPRPYLNWQIDHLVQWIGYLDESRYEVGDFHVGKSADTITTIADRFGGTWVDNGTDTLAGQTIRLFTRSA